jgi:2-polyprenyl-3-methyl-5-hydroxy-6-metoxy-1,4-benzoquinol methylase
LIISYNAGDLLRQTVDRIPIGLFDIISEIFVFDDASKDNTFEVGEELLRKSLWSGKLSLFKNPKNLGYGGNQKSGFTYGINRGMDYIVMLHGDGQYAPEHLPELLWAAAVQREPVVFGSRMVNRIDALKGGMPFYKWIGNQVLTKFENLILGLNLAEYHTGYRVYSTKVLRSISFLENTNDFHFDSQIIVQIRALGARIAEVPIKTFYGDEVSHVNGFLYAKDVCMSVLEYRLHQLHIIRRSRYLISQDVLYSRKLSPYGSHEQILSLVDRQGRALDLGSATGLLTESLLQKNVKSVGVDLIPKEQIKAPFEHYEQHDLERPEALNFKREFDFVILADIVEHLRNPDVLLTKVASFLKVDGKLIVSVPNIAIWFYRLSLLLGRFNYGPKGILDHTHVKLYTLDSIKQLLLRSGYIVKEERFTNLPFEVVFESSGKSGFIRGIDWFYGTLVKIWPRMFAYQIILSSEISGLDSLKSEGRIRV